MAHRAEAQKISGITEAQKAGLSLGRVKEDNRRKGCKQSETVKRKVAEANKRYWAEHPEQLAARGEAMRGENHYQWKGGASKLNTAIRQMNENRKWMDAVKERDGGKCVRCDSTREIESHHIIELVTLIEAYKVQTRDDARKIAKFWDLDNGITLCQPCHYVEHGRTYRADNRENIQLVA
jgi:5-methylcytosine-specific restriction endonuclease McrA